MDLKEIKDNLQKIKTSITEFNFSEVVLKIKKSIPHSKKYSFKKEDIIIISISLMLLLIYHNSDMIFDYYNGLKHKRVTPEGRMFSDFYFGMRPYEVDDILHSPRFSFFQDFQKDDIGYLYNMDVTNYGETYSIPFRVKFFFEEINQDKTRNTSSCLSTGSWSDLHKLDGRSAITPCIFNCKGKLARMKLFAVLENTFKEVNALEKNLFSKYGSTCYEDSYKVKESSLYDRFYGQLFTWDASNRYVSFQRTTIWTDSKKSTCKLEIDITGKTIQCNKLPSIKDWYNDTNEIYKEFEPLLYYNKHGKTINQFDLDF